MTAPAAACASCRSAPSCLSALRIAALAFWAGALVMTGAAAATSFPTMRDLAPALPAFAEHPLDHWAIAAGHVMRRIFAISDWVQLVCMIIAVATLSGEGILVGWRRLSVPWRVQAVGVLLATAVGAVLVLHINPDLNVALEAYWTAARSGNQQAAQEHKAIFDGGHALAGQLLTATFALVAASTFANIFAIHRAGRKEGA